MSLIKNKEGGNFYPISIPDTNWCCDYLWSTHRGCGFDCVYCSSKRLNVRFGGNPTEVRRLKGEWNGKMFPLRELPSGGIFVNPYCDMFGLPKEDITAILTHCGFALWNETEPTTFIFQTKDPAKYFDYLDMIPEGSWLGTTIASNYNRLQIEPNAPLISERYFAMKELRKSGKYNLFITIEPIMEFDYRALMDIIYPSTPDLIFIGADTGNNNLPEPTSDEVMELITELRKITTVYLKSNLTRLLPKGFENADRK